MDIDYSILMDRFGKTYTCLTSHAFCSHLKSYVEWLNDPANDIARASLERQLHDINNFSMDDQLQLTDDFFHDIHMSQWHGTWFEVFLVTTFPDYGDLDVMDHVGLETLQRKYETAS